MRIIWFSGSTYFTEEQSSLLWLWHSRLNPSFAHSSTIWRSFLFVTVMTAPLQWRALSLARLRGMLILMNPPLFLHSQEIWCRETLCVFVKPPSSSTDVVLFCSFPLLAGPEDSITEIKRDCFVPMMWWPTKPLDETGCPSATPQSH